MCSSCAYLFKKQTNIRFINRLLISYVDKKKPLMSGCEVVLQGDIFDSKHTLS